MAKALQRLLSNDSPNFTSSMQALERSTGHEGVDVRLIADVIEKSYAVVKALNLDTNDTTSKELYMALGSYIVKDPTAELLIDADYLLWGPADELVSLNLIDVIENYHHQIPFEERSLVHAQRSLRGELLSRYHEHPSTHSPTVHEHAVAAAIHDENDRHYEPVKNIIGGNPGQEDGKNDAPYILAAGDIFTDAFIKLSEEVATVMTDENGEKRLTVPLGTKPPYDKVDIVKAVGPAPNAAVAFARLGLNAGLDSFIGDDATGKEDLEYLQAEGVSTEDMLIEPGIKTNYYFVLRYGAERTILVKNEQFNYLWEAPKRTPDWIYLALMSDASWQYHNDLLKYLESNPDIKFAFQPGTFHFEWGVEKLKGLYARSYIVIMNREEAVDVTGASYDDLPALMDALHALGPKIVVVTDGPHGSYASYDSKRVQIQNYPDPADPLDRTGAGDAFAATIVAGLAQGESMDTALSWAPINSMNVVQHLGAQKGLLQKDEILKYLADAPEDYGVKPLEG